MRAVVLQNRDAHVAELQIHMGVVDDLAGKKQPPVRKFDPGLVGVLYRAVDAVTKSEFPREPDGQRADVQPIIVAAQRRRPHYGSGR